jgi:hypothetical protein
MSQPTKRRQTDSSSAPIYKFPGNVTGFDAGDPYGRGWRLFEQAAISCGNCQILILVLDTSFLVSKSKTLR